MPAFNATVFDAVQLEKYERTKTPFCVSIEWHSDSLLMTNNAMGINAQ